MSISLISRAAGVFVPAVFAIAMLFAKDSAVWAGEQADAQTPPISDVAEQLKAMEAQGKKEWEKRVHLMDQLFPKSLGWERFDQLPTALSDESRETVRSVLNSMGVNLGLRGETGDFRTDLKDYISGLKQFGANGGLIYSGPSPDREGEISAVWQGYPAGAPRPVPVMQIVRVEIGPNPRFTGLYHGCCADTLEAFARADLIDPDGVEIVRSSEMLEIPDGTIDGRFPLTMYGGFTLRFSPEVNDKPSPNTGAPEPAIGNLARRLGGSGATSLMVWFGKDHKGWVLIQTNALSDNQSFYSDPGGLPVDVGWIEESQINRHYNSAFFEWLDGVRASNGDKRL